MSTSETSTNDYQEQLEQLIAIRNETADILAWIDEEGLDQDEDESEE